MKNLTFLLSLVFLTNCGSEGENGRTQPSSEPQPKVTPLPVTPATEPDTIAPAPKPKGEPGVIGVRPEPKEKVDTTKDVTSHTVTEEIPIPPPAEHEESLFKEECLLADPEEFQWNEESKKCVRYNTPESLNIFECSRRNGSWNTQGYCNYPYNDEARDRLKCLSRTDKGHLWNRSTKKCEIHVCSKSDLVGDVTKKYGFKETSRGVYSVTVLNSWGIQNALDCADQRLGGTVRLSSRKYIVDDTIYIRGPVRLIGDGWSDVYKGSQTAGTWLVNDNPDNVVVKIKSRGAELSGIGFYFNQEPGDQIHYNYAIWVSDSDHLIKDINLYNATKGIYIRSGDEREGAIGRVTLDRIWGNPQLIGIKIKNAYDVIKINNTHFWPFFDGGYSRYNGVGIEIDRADNPMLSNIFMYSYKTGIHLLKDSATRKFHAVNLDFDACGVALHAESTDWTGTITNMSYMGNNAINGIIIDSPKTSIVFQGLTLGHTRSNIIKVTGGFGTIPRFDNVSYTSWSQQDDHRYPAIGVYGESRVVLVGSHHYETSTSHNTELVEKYNKKAFILKESATLTTQ